MTAGLVKRVWFKKENLMSLCALPSGNVPALSIGELPSDTAVLIDHILDRYHETHRREFDELIRMARRVEAAHAGHPSLPADLSKLLYEMKIELDLHMHKEEHVLFPLMKSGDSEMIDQPISMMLIDHEDHLALVRLLIEVTGGCTAPTDACGTWRNLYAGIRKLLDDLLAHIEIENKTLFPRFTNSQLL